MYPSCHKNTWRKARKQHTCVECGQQITKGETYLYHSGVWDGEPASFKQCRLCAETFEIMLTVDDGFTGEGIVLGDLREYMREYADHHYGTTNPFVIADNLNLDVEHTAKLMG